MKRLLWIDISKGLAILFVAYFHFFSTYFQHGVLPPPDWSNVAASALTFLRLAWFKISGLGFHAVGVFIILSGWTLMQSTVRRAEKGEIAWGAWYWARFLRLYPMYWVAHLVYLVSPFVARLEPVDDRIILSLLGLRFIDIDMNFMYLNAAWWYFAMLIQFYAIFPLLFWTARRVGPWWFLFIGCAAGFFARYVLLVLWPQNGLWVLGGFAICRLPEFALGMSLSHVVFAIARSLGMVPSSRRGIRSRLDPLPCGTAALSRTFRLHLCRFRHRRVLHAGNRWHRWIDFAV